MLGGAVSVEVRGLDFLVVGVISLLATLSLADVIYLNLRERASEIVTLRTFGWSDLHLAQMIATESIVVGLAGTLAGAVVGLLISLQLGVPLSSVLLAGVTSIIGGLRVSLLAALVPLARLSTLTTASVLAEE